MRGARFGLGCLVALGAFSALWACGVLPDPEGDFGDYQGRIKEFPTQVIEASAFEAAPPPTQAVDGLYYAACLSELAFSQPTKVFNFYTVTKFVPGVNGATAKLTLSIQPLAVVATAPPPTITQAGAVGPPIPAPAADVATNGKYLIAFTQPENPVGVVTVLGTANPITGSDVLIEGATLEGRFAEAKFCGRLGGTVVKPEAAARTLDPTKNICQFVPIKDGDPTPKFTVADFQAESCPLE